MDRDEEELFPREEEKVAEGRISVWRLQEENEEGVMAADEEEEEEKLEEEEEDGVA